MTSAATSAVYQGAEQSTMKAVGVVEFGGPDALGLHELPVPHAVPGSVRIRVHAATVNPTDTLVRSGGGGNSDALQPPHIPGMDAAGIIDEVGAGSRWNLGDQVMAVALPLTEHGGAYVEYLVAPDDSLTKIPDGTTLDEAATIPMNGLTALQILELAHLEPGQVLAVTGAAGTLGNYLIQLAKHAGLTVIADAGPKDVPLIESLGADHIVDRGNDVAVRIREIFPDGVDAIADAALLHELVVPALKDDGTFVSVRLWKGEPTRQIRFEAAFVADEYHSSAKLDRLRELVNAGVLTPSLAEVLSATDAADAHRRLEAGGARGRSVLRF